MRHILGGLILVMLAALLGMLGLGLVTGIVIGAAFLSPARAQDHHPFHREFYREWQRPDGKGSCCNARIFINGHEIGDCEPTEARVVAGQWYARLPANHGGAFIPIPDAAILRVLNPTQGGVDAHLCWTPANEVMCFVPPTGAM